jgi:quercetin dioxygenase-like cupin family protein
MKTKVLVLLATACGAFLLGGGIVLAEPADGFNATHVDRGTIARAAEIDANGIEYASPRNAHVIIQQGEFLGGGKSGWHTHPGLTIVTVVDGSVTNRTGCSAAVVYHPLDSFVEPPNTPISVNNVSPTVKAHVVAVLVVPDGIVAPRTDVNAPVCTGPEDD